MTGPHPAVLAALAAGLEREDLEQIAIGLGFDRGVAPQVAALAAEVSRATGMSARQYLEMMSRLMAAESAGRGYDALARLRPRHARYKPLHRAWNACRHAVEVARQVLLHR